MQENEFEKKLQHKLEVLQVQPTTEVWQKIKAQVEQKKKKRRLAIYFLLAFLLGAGTLITTMLADKNADTVIAVHEKTAVGVTETNTSVVVPANTNKAAIKQNEFKQDGNVPAGLVIREIDKTKVANPGAGINSSAIAKNTFSAAEIITSHNPVRKKTKAKLGIKTIAPPVSDEENIKDNIAEETNAANNNDLTAQSIAIAPLKENAKDIPALNTDEKRNEIQTITTDEKKQQEKTVAAAKKEKKKNTKHKWGIAISIAGGVNFVANSNQQKNISQDYNNGGGGVTPNNTGNYFIPGALQKGTGMAVGIQVYRKLTSSVHFTTGLQYNFNTLSIQTGNRIDTSAIALEVYRSGSSVAYTNRYHYLTVPVSLSIKLFNAGNKEIIMDAGGSISTLLGTNALSFNNSQGRYYTGKNELNKTIVSLNMFAAINLAGSNKPAFYIGPQINYSLTPIASAGLHSGRHATFIGLKAQMNLMK